VAGTANRRVNLPGASPTRLGAGCCDKPVGGNHDKSDRADPAARSSAVTWAVDHEGYAAGASIPRTEPRLVPGGDATLCGTTPAMTGSAVPVPQEPQFRSSMFRIRSSCSTMSCFSTRRRASSGPESGSGSKQPLLDVRTHRQRVDKLDTAHSMRDGLAVTGRR
jgi:hypothetical protein